MVDDEVITGLIALDAWSEVDWVAVLISESDVAIEVNPSGAGLISEVIVAVSEASQIPIVAINGNGVDAAESVGAVITVIKIAVLNDEVIALFITKSSDCIVIR